MKRTTLLKLIAGMAFAILMLATLVQFSASAQEAGTESQGDEQMQEEENSRERNSNARALEGSWDLQVTLRNCQNGTPIRTFPGMNTFMRGGTMQETGAGTPPSLRTPGHGVWSHLGGRRFSTVLQFFRFNADGTYAGTQKARKQIELSRFASTYTSTATVEIFDANGNLIGTSCATETAARFE